MVIVREKGKEVASTILGKRGNAAEDKSDGRVSKKAKGKKKNINNKKKNDEEVVIKQHVVGSDGQQQEKKKKKKKRTPKKLEAAHGAKVGNEPELFDWFVGLYEKSGQKLSKLELYPNGTKLDKSNFVPGDSNFGFIKKHLAGSKDGAKVLLITASAIRACQLNKLISSQLRMPVAKLFAKHMKLEEQEAFLKKGHVSIGVGTPNRMLRLVETGALDGFVKDPKTLVIFDLFRDAKLFNVLTMPTVSNDCFAFVRKIMSKENMPKMTFLGESSSNEGEDVKK